MIEKKGRHCVGLWFFSLLHQVMIRRQAGTQRKQLLSTQGLGTSLRLDPQRCRDLMPQDSPNLLASLREEFGHEPGEPIRITRRARPAGMAAAPPLHS